MINAIYDILTHEYDTIKKENMSKDNPSNCAIMISEACRLTKEQFKNIKDIGIAKYTGKDATIRVIDYNGAYLGDFILAL